MKKSKAKVKSRNLVIIAVSVIALIAVTVLVTTVNSFYFKDPDASTLKFTITSKITDRFNDDVLDTSLWEIEKVTKGDVNTRTVKETKNDNLVISVPADSHSSWVGVRSKNLIEDLGDFQNYAVMFRPTVNGDGQGRAGMRFISMGSDNDESAAIFWQVSEDRSKDEIIFQVKDSTGKMRLNVKQRISSNVAVLRIQRSNKTYRAYFKNSMDLTGDTGWTLLGTCSQTQNCNAGLGKSGKVSYFVNNGVVNNKYPKLTVKFDTAMIRWEDSSVPKAERVSFQDSFNNRDVSSKWRLVKSVESIKVVESKAMNLVITLPDTNSTKKVASIRLKRLSPVVGIDDNFSFQVQAFKPQVSTDGAGALGVRFLSASTGDDSNKEAASVRWVATKAGESYLVFSVADRSGESVERAKLNIDPKLEKIVLLLKRTDNKYSAYYSISNNDASYVQLGGVAVEDTFGENGNVFLFASNLGEKVNSKEKYPEVKARFDNIIGKITEK